MDAARRCPSPGITVSGAVPATWSFCKRMNMMASISPRAAEHPQRQLSMREHRSRCRARSVFVCVMTQYGMRSPIALPSACRRDPHIAAGKPFARRHAER